MTAGNFRKRSNILLKAGRYNDLEDLINDMYQKLAKKPNPLLYDAVVEMRYDLKQFKEELASLSSVE